ncbi:MAG: T9SS type A sorting domain-containing protein [Cryomorphaceae bacterium]|nr:T9SS type A sorting domain-containing protein [Cryomorphaceae bacterium]
MKKAILLLLSFPFLVFGQSLEIVDYDSVIYGHPTTSFDIYGHATIKNNSGQSIDVKVKRSYDLSNTLTQSNAICWGMCFSTTVDVSPDPIAIGAGQSNSTDFNGHVYPPMDGSPRSGQITYIFFDANNPDDSVAMTVTYITTNSFSVNEAKQKSGFNVYPNPAKGSVWLDLQNINEPDITVMVNDVIGNNVIQKNVRSFGNREQINLQGLRSGYYFISIYANDRLIGTKRIQVIQ